MKNDIMRILEENTRILSLLKRIPLRNPHFRPMELPEPPREASVPPRGLKRPRGAPESHGAEPHARVSVKRWVSAVGRPSAPRPASRRLTDTLSRPRSQRETSGSSTSQGSGSAVSSSASGPPPEPTVRMWVARHSSGSPGSTRGPLLALRGAVGRPALLHEHLRPGVGSAPRSRRRGGIRAPLRPPFPAAGRS